MGRTVARRACARLIFYPELVSRRDKFIHSNVADYLITPNVPARRRLPSKQFNPRNVTNQSLNAPPCFGGLFAVSTLERVQ